MNFNQYLELNEQHLNIRGIPGSFMSWLEPQWIDQKTRSYKGKFDLKSPPIVSGI